MSMLGRGLLGMAGGLGTGITAVAQETVKYNHEAARDAAKAEKDTALENLRSRNDVAATIGTEERAQERSDGTLNDKFRINGKIPTNAQLRENASDNEAVGLIQSDINKRVAPSAPEGKPWDSAAKGAQTEARRGTADEQEAMASYDAAGKITSHSDEILAEKSALATQLMQAKVEMTLKVADMRYEQAKELSQMKQRAGDTAEYKQSLLDLKKADAQRKSATAAAAYSEKIGAEPTPEQAKILNNLLLGAGEEPVAAPAMTRAEATKKATTQLKEEKKTGLLGRAKQSDIDPLVESFMYPGKQPAAPAKPADKPAMGKVLTYDPKTKTLK